MARKIQAMDVVKVDDETFVRRPSAEADTADELCAGPWDEVWREARPRLSAIQAQVMEGLVEGKAPETIADERGITRNPLYQEKYRQVLGDRRWVPIRADVGTRGCSLTVSKDVGRVPGAPGQGPGLPLSALSQPRRSKEHRHLRDAPARLRLAIRRSPFAAARPRWPRC